VKSFAQFARSSQTNSEALEDLFRSAIEMYSATAQRPGGCPILCSTLDNAGSDPEIRRFLSDGSPPPGNNRSSGGGNDLEVDKKLASRFRFEASAGGKNGRQAKDRGRLTAAVIHSIALRARAEIDHRETSQRLTIPRARASPIELVVLYARRDCCQPRGQVAKLPQRKDCRHLTGAKLQFFSRKRDLITRSFLWTSAGGINSIRNFLGSVQITACPRSSIPKGLAENLFSLFESGAILILPRREDREILVTFACRPLRNSSMADVPNVRRRANVRTTMAFSQRSH